VITAIHILSYEDMHRQVANNLVPAGAAIISITDPEEDPIFPEDTDDILTFQFHDVDPEWFQGPTWTEEARNAYRWMQPEEAKRCFEFVRRHHEKPDVCFLYVNCMAGISRSGAVGTFAHRYAQTDRDHFERTNPEIMPNTHVLRLLMREWYGRDWPELEG
jgi:predicted protein tyrosine phosphatase